MLRMSLKRVMTFLILAFLLFFLVQEPVEAARVVRTAGESLGRTLSVLAEGLTRFLSSLF